MPLCKWCFSWYLHRYISLFRAATERYDTYENGMAAAKAEAAKPKGSRESRACAQNERGVCPVDFMIGSRGAHKHMRYGGILLQQQQEHTDTG